MIHLDPTGMSLGSTGSADEKVVRAAQAQDAKNVGQRTACGLSLADVKVERRGAAEISEVTCLACLGEYQHDVTTTAPEGDLGG